MTVNDQQSNHRDRFEKAWAPPGPGLSEWFKPVSAQAYGLRFMTTAFAFFIIAGVMGLLIRVQLAVPDNTFIGPEVFNQLFTMHGSTMMYLVVLPFIEGLALYLIPSLLGTREMAFPRISAFSYWVYLFGGLVFYSGFLFNSVPDTGWFFYPPFSLSTFSDKGMDFLLVGLAFIEVAGIATGIEIVVTILKFRGMGMSLSRMPIFAWGWLVTGVMIVFAFSTLLGATILLELDRAVGTKFFVPEAGGNALLWQHLFWFFGHPDVYIIFIPATAIISMVIPAWAKRPLAGHVLVVVAIVVTGFLSFGLWAHHMFATGLPMLALGFFAAASVTIGLTSGTQVFAWIATLWRTRPPLNTSFLYMLGFFIIFTLGGLTGIMVAVLPFDLQAHDTYFVVAHFHYVIIGGVFFPVLGGIHYWTPLLLGKMPSERIGKWSFWLTFAGFNITFFPMHIVGLQGMARRVYTYPEELGIGQLNFLSTLGAFILGIGFVVFAYGFFYTYFRGEKAPKNPWKAGTQEWMTDKDMANYVYLAPPIITDRYPLWRSEEDRSFEHNEFKKLSDKLSAKPSEWRATLVTDVITAKPQGIHRVPGPTYIPVTTATAFMISVIAVLAETYILALLGLVAGLICTGIWLWPKEHELGLLQDNPLEAETGLSLQPTGTAAMGWWGMLGLICSLGMTFAVLFYAYFYLRLFSTQWPQDSLPMPDWLWPGVFTGLICVSAVGNYLAKSYVTKQKRNGARLFLLLTSICGLIYSLYFAIHLSDLGFSVTHNAYSSIFYVTALALILLVMTGSVLLFLNWVFLGQSYVRMKDGIALLFSQVVSLYWYFTIAVTIFGYGVLYVSPYLF